MQQQTKLGECLLELVVRYFSLIRLICNSEESLRGEAFALQLRDELLKSSAFWVLFCCSSPGKYPLSFSFGHLPESVSSQMPTHVLLNPDNKLGVSVLG